MGNLTFEFIDDLIAAVRKTAPACSIEQIDHELQLHLCNIGRDIEVARGSVWPRFGAEARFMYELLLDIAVTAYRPLLARELDPLLIERAIGEARAGFQVLNSRKNIHSNEEIEAIIRLGILRFESILIRPCWRDLSQSLLALIGACGWLAEEVLHPEPERAALAGMEGDGHE